MGKMRILGIDPGTAIIGYGMIECERGEVHCGNHHAFYGCITTEKDRTAERRLSDLYDGMTNLLRTYKPDVISIEKLFFARNVTTALAVGEARGVILLSAEQAGVAVVGYTPMQMKQQMTGYGKAEKKQVKEMIKRILMLEKDNFKTDDAWDAIGLALTHCYLTGLATRPEFIVDYKPEKKLKVKSEKLKVKAD